MGCSSAKTKIEADMLNLKIKKGHIEKERKLLLIKYEKYFNERLERKAVPDYLSNREIIKKKSKIGKVILKEDNEININKKENKEKKEKIEKKDKVEKKKNIENEEKNKEKKEKEKKQNIKIVLRKKTDINKLFESYNLNSNNIINYNNNCNKNKKIQEDNSSGNIIVFKDYKSGSKEKIFLNISQNKNEIKKLDNDKKNINEQIRLKLNHEIDLSNKERNKIIKEQEDNK